MRRPWPREGVVPYMGGESDGNPQEQGRGCAEREKKGKRGGESREKEVRERRRGSLAEEEINCKKNLERKEKDIVRIREKKGF